MDLSVPIVVGIEMSPEITIDARTGQVVGGGGGPGGAPPADVLSGFAGFAEQGLQAGLQNLLQPLRGNQNGAATASQAPAGSDAFRRRPAATETAGKTFRHVYTQPPLQGSLVFLSKKM